MNTLSYVSSLGMFFVGVLSIISFSSPYWIESKTNRFKQLNNMGLWEVSNLLAYYYSNKKIYIK